ncbi:metallophosphoesterase family protein [Oryzobacter telluris]|uniref:metallophosphoesterase family protein n=1 Tax=Oryzobacter telluris TaxID=3149179 RepID=UPI00370D98C0
MSVVAVALAGVVATQARSPTSATAAAGSTLFADGFESGGTGAWTTSTGLVVQQAVVSEGSFAARATTTGGAAYASRTLASTQPDLVASLALQLVSGPTGASLNFLKVRTASGAALAEVYLTTSRVLGVRNDVLGTATNSPVAVAAGSWHAVALHVVVAGSSSRLQVDLDGTRLLDLTTDLGSTAVGRVQLGENVAGRTADVVFDAVSVSVPAPPPPPVPPPVFADGFETGDLSAWTSGSGLVVQQAVVSDGLWAARATMTGAAANASRTLATPLTDVTVSVRVRVQSLSGTAAVNFLKVRTAAGTALAEVYVTPAGVLGVRDAVAARATNSTVVVAPGAWHTVVLRAVTGPGTLRVSLDGATVLDVVSDLGATPVGRVQVGENVAGRTADLVYDTVRVDGPTTPTATDPVLLAAGDIACDPLSGSFNGGNGTSDACRQKAVSDLVLTQSGVSAVAALGDIQYACGGYQAFLAAYDPTWGRFKGMTRPAVGNHEYLASISGPATDCDPTGTAAGYFRYFGSAAGQQGQGWYGYDLGAWHVVVLNSNCGEAGGCGPGSPQEVWLRADLAAHPTRCTLAYWHIPLWSSGGRAANNARTFVQDLVAAGAEVVLNGHDHIYERFAPMDATGARSATGVREFVVGTGGANHTTVVSVAPNSEVRDAATYGVLRLVLHPGGYDWQFLPEAGHTFSDAGSDTCH